MKKENKKKNVIILGAGGRDFHDFLTVFKDNPKYNVVCFTATQIPGIEKRIFPAKLAGKYYRKGVPIYPESQLKDLIKKFKIDFVILAYSDLSHQEVMEKAGIALAAGADFKLMSPEHTQLVSKKPVIAVTAVRTGAGKSPAMRNISKHLRKKGYKVAVIRHPMPYGNLQKQEVQVFKTLDDLKKHNCTFEEDEEYEPHIKNGFTVYAGVDYEKILRKAEKDAEIILWDGGNNDFSFYKPDLHICIADARRAGHEITYYPGFTNFITADTIIINKIKTAPKEDINKIVEHAKKYNPKANLIFADMEKTLDKNINLKGKKVLAIEDGPTTTHGGMSFGAAYLVAKAHGAKIIDPRPYAVGSIKQVFAKFKHLTNILPAMGYNKQQIQELQETINKAKADYVLIGTPIDLRRLLKINKPAIKVNYELKEIQGNLDSVLDNFLKNKIKKSRKR
ncbi:MAG: cyclic 2,3-diphosphoglycerate synthase [Nanoarchaeota archaeon]|nr:cyclic 2,3-diphosphoglycerate synthase [Nanoarchaeota archaeon]